MPDKKTLVYIIGFLLGGSAAGTGLVSFASGEDKMQNYRISELEDDYKKIMKSLEEIKERLPGRDR